MLKAPRIAVVADIHHGQPTPTKRGDAALALLERFTTHCRAIDADLVLDLGDRITDVDHPTDMRLAGEVAEVFRALDVPIRHICGNHDRNHLSVADNEALLGQALGHETLDLGGWRIALWRAEARIERRPEYTGFVLHEADLTWLAGTAQRADRPLMVVSHVPISGHSQIGNYYFENKPESSVYPMADRARAALALARVPVFCIAGHVHWNTITTCDGITHLTQQSLTESFTTRGEPAGAMGMIELGETVTWEVGGEDPIRFAFRPSAVRWMPPRPVASAHPEPPAMRNRAPG